MPPIRWRSATRFGPRDCSSWIEPFRASRIGSSSAGSAAAPCARRSPEREREGLHAGIEELDLEGAIADRPALSDELVEALLRHHAVAGGVDVVAVVGARGRAVEGDAEAHR